MVSKRTMYVTQKMAQIGSKGLFVLSIATPNIPPPRTPETPLLRRRGTSLNLVSAVRRPGRSIDPARGIRGGREGRLQDDDPRLVGAGGQHRPAGRHAERQNGEGDDAVAPRVEVHAEGLLDRAQVASWQPSARNGWGERNIGSGGLLVFSRM